MKIINGLKGLRKKTYLKTILSQLVISLIIPLVTIFLLWGFSEKLVKEHIIKTSDNTLKLFVELIEDTMNDVVNTSYTIGFDTHCEAYAQNALVLNRYGYESYELCTALKPYQNEKLTDLFVYFPKYDQIVSAKHGTFSTRNYFQTFYETKGVSKSDFTAIIDTQEMKPKLFVMERNTKDAFFCVAMGKRTIKKSQNDYVVVQVIDSAYLSRIMKAAGSDTSGELAIFDADRNMLVGPTQILEYQLSGDKNLQERFEESFSGNQYTIQTIKAKSIDGYYAVITQSDYFWEQLQTLRTIFAVGCMICILLSIVVIYRGGQRTYRPVKEMIQAMETHSDVSFRGDKHEFDFFKDIVNRYSEEKESLSLKDKRNEKLRKEKAVRALLYSQGTQKKREVQENNAIQFINNKFLVALITVEEGCSLEPDMLAFSLQNVISELFGPDQPIYLLRYDYRSYTLLVNFVNEGEVDSLLKQTQSFFSVYFFPVSVFRGRSVEGKEKIHMAFKEARAAYQYYYLFGAGCFVPYELIADRYFIYPFSDDSKLTIQMLNFFKGKNSVRSAEEFLEDIMSQYSINENSAIETVDCFRYELISALRKAMALSSFSESEAETIDSIMKKSCLKEFIAAVAERLQEIWTIMQEEDRGICTKAKEYVHRNYQNNQLSVDMIGERLHISSWYLSKLFKEKFGVSLFDYIRQVRISEAKKLLSETHLNLSEISERVGYSNSKVFIGNFKKTEGITPGSYRDGKQEK